MSLGTVTRSLLKGYRNRFPEASEEHLRTMLLKHFEIAAHNPKAKDEEITAEAELALEEAAENGEDWAVALKNSFRDNVIRPIAEKAKARGVDPVAAIVYEIDSVTDAEARKLVEELNATQVPAQAEPAEVATPGDAEDDDLVTA